MAHDTQLPAPLPEAVSPQAEELQSCLLTICPPPSDRSVLKRRRGRPGELTLPHLALGVLVCSCASCVAGKASSISGVGCALKG